jgi:hypothetical protein
MQHHAGKRPARALAPMRAAPLGPLQEAARMKKCLRPRIAPAEPMMFNQPLMKMLGREADIPLPIERLHLGSPRRRNPFGRHLAQPPVKQAWFALRIVAIPPTPKRPLADAQQLRRFQLTELRGFVTSQNVQELDHPHTLMGFRPPHPKPSKRPQITGQIVRYLNRTYHLLPTVSDWLQRRTL